MNDWKRQAGVTLIELIIVIAIIGIILGIAITTVGNRSPVAQLKSDARDIVSNMQLARVNAIRDTRPWAIQFDTDNQRYLIYSNSGEEWKSEDWADGDETVFRNVMLNRRVNFGTNKGARPGGTMPANGSITYSANRVVFNPNGTSESGTVYLTIGSGETIAISSLSTTGRIKVWENFGNAWNE
jgi:type II secretion system protein H